MFSISPPCESPSAIIVEGSFYIDEIKYKILIPLLFAGSIPLTSHSCVTVGLSYC